MSDPTYYEVRAKFDLYTGNFEREMTHWVFGMENEHMPGGWDCPERPHAESMEWAGGEYCEGTLVTFAHDEYGLVYQTIDVDHSAEEPGYFIEWRLEKIPSNEQWAALRKAIESFPGGRYSGSPKLLDLKLTKIETVRTELR